MSKINLIKNAGFKLLGKKSLVLSKHSPKILMVVGAVGFIGTAVLVGKGTLNADKKIKESKEKLKEIKSVKETYSEMEYSKQDYRKDLTVHYTTLGFDIVKTYTPALVVGGITLGCFFGAHNILNKRNIAVMAAYKAVSESFKEYQTRVKDTFGEDAANKIKYNLKGEILEISEIDEKGKVKKSKKELIVSDKEFSEYSQYARIFDESSINYSKIPEYNLTFLNCQQNYANDLLKARGHVFLNEVYDMLGIPRSKAGSIVGWVLNDAGDNFIDFGIYNVDRPKARDFVNGYERAIVLDFNVDGVIYDLI